MCLPKVDPASLLLKPSAQPLPNSIRVACASNSDEMLDGHFGSCPQFLIYQVSADNHQLVEVRPVQEPEEGEKNSYRAQLISDCQLLFVVSIGGPAAAKVVRAGVHPIKKPLPVPADQEMVALQKALSAGVAPWLAKAMGHQHEQRVRFRPDGMELLEDEA